MTGSEGFYDYKFYLEGGRDYQDSFLLCLSCTYNIVIILYDNRLGASQQQMGIANILIFL